MPRKRIYFTAEERLEGRRQSNRKSYYANLERSRERNRLWYRKNKDKLRPQWALRDRRKRQAEGDYTPNDIERIYSDQRGRCAICSKKLGRKFHRDHIVPLARGGTNWPSNIQLLCPPCNISKGAKDPIEHMRDLGRLL